MITDKMSFSANECSNLRQPVSLYDISLKSVFGISSEIAFSEIRQLSASEVADLVILRKFQRASFSRYESKYNRSLSKSFFINNVPITCDSTLLPACSWKEKINMINDISIFSDESLPSEMDIVHWKDHPMYKLVQDKNYNHDNIDSYRRISEELSSFPVGATGEIFLGIDEIFSRHDPLYFLRRDTIWLCDKTIAINKDPINIIKSELLCANWLLELGTNELINCRKETTMAGSLIKNVINLAFAANIQLKIGISLLFTLIHYRSSCINSHEETNINSLEIISGLMKFKKDLKNIKKLILPIIEYTNFMNLEDILDVNKLNLSLIRNSIRIYTTEKMLFPYRIYAATKLTLNESIIINEITMITYYLKERYHILMRERQEKILLYTNKILHCEEKRTSTFFQCLLRNSIRILEKEIEEMKKLIDDKQ